MRFALLFPGQGSQKVGMGLDLYEKTKIIKELFKQVDVITGRNISKIFLYGPEEELNQTKNTQTAIVTVSVALTLLLQQELKNKNLTLNPLACAGHSLGEFTALWFLNILNFENLIKLVSTRSTLMQNAPPGCMAAILNLSELQIKEILTEKEFKDNFVIANYNNPSQFVISGKKELFDNIAERIKLSGGKTIILPTSGAFHSPLMEEPSKAFTVEIEKFLTDSTNNTEILIYQNTDGLPSTNLKVVKEKIKKQMTSPVLWTQTINNIVKSGVTATIEIGPGKVLSGLVKKINSSIDCYNIYDLSSLEEFLKQYEHKLFSQQSSKTP